MHAPQSPVAHGLIDPDAAVPAPTPQARWDGQGPVVAVVSLGGGLDAAARYAAGVAWPAAPDAFPWTTPAVNVVGCALIGILLVLVTEVRQPHRLVRPFLGTGVLGGFTTFSTYVVDVQRLVDHHQARQALGYLAGTLAAASAAVCLGTWATRRVAVAKVAESPAEAS
ncbi:fluoride efflux transporter CrcB [Yinghuangia aomiensis]|uniref:Fluoride-specific ion channel FluC n=1 Tax=Yinghuangia aomiensis TaxID=676205 RepID=A0ABP9IAL3_9ACTN